MNSMFGSSQPKYLDSYANFDKVVERFLPTLMTPRCNYLSFEQARSVPLFELLHPTQPTDCEPLELVTKEEVETFNGFWWAEWTSHNWQYPIVACIVYLTMLYTLQRFMGQKVEKEDGTLVDRAPIRLQPVVLAWNFGLSAFSFAGVLACVPHLLADPEHGLFTGGFSATICTHPSSYGIGLTGFFVAAFVYSKIFELIDTLWLVLRKAPVILLHWYHHVTVLLYVWHSYSCRISTGLWFASLNYSVHSIMYFYYGLTQCGPTAKKMAKRIAMFITTIQLLQMVGGIVVTVGSVIQHAQGEPCFVSLTNSFLGLLMYSSYFALFLQLFLQHYVYGKKPKPKKTDVELNSGKDA